MATETQAEIDRINTEVSTQASKIAQLSSILDGKAAGGGSGGVETCNVTISVPAFGYFVYINGSSELVSEVLGPEDYNATVSVINPSLIYLPTGSFPTVSGDCEAYDSSLVYVYGDATIDCT